jgi:hypothetical protein
LRIIDGTTGIAVAVVAPEVDQIVVEAEDRRKHHADDEKVLVVAELPQLLEGIRTQRR